MSIMDEVQKAVDNAREDGCALCPDPRKPTTFILKVIAVHPECLHDPDGTDDEDDEKEEVVN